MQSEIEILQSQLNSNNNQIQRLLVLLDRIRSENSLIMSRINTSYRELNYTRDLRDTRDLRESRESRESREREPRNRVERPRNQELREPENQLDASTDILFYFYLPRTLSPETIRRETTLTTFRDIESPNNLSCPICLEQFQPDQEVTIINSCKHIFNTTQLTTWFEDKTTCPVCRYDLQTQRTREGIREGIREGFRDGFDFNTVFESLALNRNNI